MTDADEFAEDIPDPGMPPKVAEWFADMRLMHRAWRGDPTNDENRPPLYRWAASLSSGGV